MYTQYKFIKKDRGAEHKSNRKSPLQGSVKGFSAEAVKTAGVFISWAEGEYLSDCRRVRRAIGFRRIVSFCQTAGFSPRSFPFIFHFQIGDLS